MFEEVNEAYTTQICSCCGEITASSPKGRADLGIREWSCECLDSQRDLNSAMNILALGHERLAVGIPLLGEDVKRNPFNTRKTNFFLKT